MNYYERRRSSVVAGFGGTCGVLLALFLIFIVMPLGCFIGLAAIGSAVGPPDEETVTIESPTGQESRYEE